MAKMKHPRPRERTLTETAYLAIKRAILQGEIEEGSFLSQADLRRRHGIGRTPFREACIRLQHEGLLQAVPRRGFLVPETSLRALREMFELRMTLEPAVAEVAAAKAKPEQIEELERLAKRSWSLSNSNSDPARLVKANTDFHLCLARMTQNRQLIQIMTWTLERTERLSYLELQGSPVLAKEIRMLHRPIVDAILKRDLSAARKAVLNDIRQGQSDIFGQHWWTLDQE